MDRFVQLPPAERRTYFEQTAGRMRLNPQIIVKDFWVCWTLRELFALPAIGDTLIFKGGTSLSKVYRLIERFSEDIDVSIDRGSLGMDDASSPEDNRIGTKERQRRIARLKTLCQRKIYDELQPAMMAVIKAKISGTEEWSLTLDAGDPDQQTLLFQYPASMPIAGSAYIRSTVKIEMGARSDHWPSDQKKIASYVAEQFPGAFTPADFSVKVLVAERTFWEKATLLHAEYHRPPDKELPARLSRHYYDMARLILAGIGDQAKGQPALLQRVVEHKKIFFSSGWAHYDEAKPGSLRLTPAPERVKALEDDYDRMQEMFFAERPSFADILRTIGEWENLFNRS